MEVLLDTESEHSAAVVNMPDVNGNTPLHLAAQAGIIPQLYRISRVIVATGNFLTVTKLLRHPR